MKARRLALALAAAALTAATLGVGTASASPTQHTNHAASPANVPCC